MNITADQKKEIYKKYGGNEKNSGSTEAQIVILTQRIRHITEHLKVNKKDNSTLRSLDIMVSRRKKMLKYLTSVDIEKYRALIAELGLRR